MDDSERSSRLALAGALRESADYYSAEQALRDSLSRSYYSVFHVGCVLIGRGFGNHAEFLKELQVVLGDDAAGRLLVAKVEEIQNLRIQADYVFDAVERYYEADLRKFRQAASDGLRLGHETYEALLKRIADNRKGP